MKDATKQIASRAAAKRKVPYVTIYVLSNGPNHEEDILRIFQDVPTRILRLRATDFFTSKQLEGLSESMMSVGQYAAMYAAKMDHGSPILLLNAASAITYMAIDRDSKFLGGGACPGMSIRCRTLFDYCSKEFPNVGFPQYKQITDKAKLDKKPISLFASDMEAGIAANATAELAGQLRNIVKQFLKLVGPSEKPATVVVTGDDMEILNQLLKENCSGLIETEPDVEFPSSDKVTLSSRKNQAPYGVEHLLVANMKKRATPHPDEEHREQFIGLRVAAFKKPSKTVFRGSISRIVPGKRLEEDTFVVLLEDDETVCLDFVQIYGTLHQPCILVTLLLLYLTKITISCFREDAMTLYREVGEKDKEENEEEWVEEKREASSKVQVNLEEKNDQIKKRKIELDAAKEKEGSIINALCPEEESRAKKRPKPTPKKKDDTGPKKFIGQRIAKYFMNPNEVLYFGTIDNYTASKKLWHVTYDDDDEEEYDRNDVREAILLYAKNKDDDENPALAG